MTAATVQQPLCRGTGKKAADPLARPYQKSGPEPDWDWPLMLLPKATEAVPCGQWGAIEGSRPGVL